MTVPYSVSDNDVVLPADVNQYKKMIEGASGYTTTYALQATSGTDFNITLGDAAGVRKLNIKDSAGNVVYSIDSDGGVISGAITPTVLIAPLSTAPAQTAEGSVVWDSDDDVLTVGDGASRKTFYPGAADVDLVGESTAATSTTSTSAVDLVTISGLSILVTQPFRIEFNCRKQALAAQVVSFGLKANSTVVCEANASGYLAQSSGTNRAEDGMAVCGISPRSSANYLNGLLAFSQWFISASGATTGAQKSGTGNDTLTAPMPNATITSIAIRALNVTTSNAAEVTSVRILTGIS